MASPDPTEIHPAIVCAILAIVLVALWIFDQMPPGALDLALSYGGF